MAPVSAPVLQLRGGANGSEVLKNASDGLLWRGVYTKTGRLVWYMSGTGGQFCLVLPEERIVFTKTNGIGKSNQPFTNMQDFESLITNLVKNSARPL